VYADGTSAIPGNMNCYEMQKNLHISKIIRNIAVLKLNGMSIYDELEKLKRLLDEGAITQEEYEREKSRVLAYQPSMRSNAWDFGIDEKSFVALMQASQFLSAFIAPLVMWLLFRAKSAIVDEAGKNILNFQLSYLLYFLLLIVTCVGILLIPILAIMMAVLIVIAIIKSLNGESWRYPLSIRFLK